MSEYSAGVVGAKSKNLAGLRGKLPADINLPASVTIPFGVYEASLEAPANKQIRSQLKVLVERINALPRNHAANGGLHVPDDKRPAALLQQCRELAMQVEVPAEVQSALAAAMKEAGIPLPAGQERWAQALAALKGVWASKYNERAYLSLRKVRAVAVCCFVSKVTPP